ncbi:MAG: GAF domain-containing protein [Synergistaceae bacterium]|jgi:GAF domain-containing protein|nr:GAF domain-containing protein [Synergistaceae bacterium]
MDVDVRKFENKRDMYAHLNASLVQMLGESVDVVACLSNASALLGLFLEEINWVGFYLMKNGMLILGPFQGKPAVMQIRPGEGVCGTAVKERKIQRVDDVHTCANHIACDLASSSEIVVPMMKDGEVWGVLDIDSPIVSRFDEEDASGLESFVTTLLPLLHPEA